MNVWVTRTEPGAFGLAAALRAAGYGVLQAPVLGIRRKPFAPVEETFDIGLFLSAHAAQIATADLADKIQAPFAVGRRTQAALRTLGLDAAVPDCESSEGLLKALPDVAGKRILVITGVGGRTLLADALQCRGAEVTRLDVYLRYPLMPTVAAEAVDVILASSGDGLRQAAIVWAAAGGDPDIPVLTPSARVAALGAELGLSSVRDCGGADAQAVLRTLGQLELEEGRG